ncbi:MAG: ABC transporter permease [Melioribacteraceae bacterium]|nr:ABC transporter permease [Melioribacteraceae bacterium]MCF8356711.1 ABC transporter permease [Melioribacteraceae bacterium]MCF8396095.1 ABC transporter permease [Melioribacteraceae bacterium]MCF8421081.1 ABC transporter permease [Melioribacteraceae bacterium]
MRTVIHFIKKEFLQFRRDPKMVAMILVAPIIQLIFLGYAATFDVNTVHTAVFDQDKTSLSREYIQKLEYSGYFAIDYHVNNYDDLTKLIDNGEVVFGLVIPNDFEKKINRRVSVPVQGIFDGSDGNKGSIAGGYVLSVTLDFSKNIISEFMDRSGQKISLHGNVNPEIRVWYNPELKTRNFMVPGIFGLLMMLVTLILTSLAIVKEKEIGTLEQLIVTPIKPFQMILGKLIPFTILGFISVIIVLTAMTLIFNIPVRGSTTFLFFATFLYILSLLGFGLFVSTVSKTQQQAMMISIFVIMLPMIYLSGFAFPIENMPEFIQYLTYVIPLRYFITIIRGVILKGIGFAELWQETLILFMMGLLILFFSSLRFRKRIE